MKGTLVSPDDSRDVVFERMAQSPLTVREYDLPDEYDLRPDSLMPRSQGQRGTCAAFAGAAIKEIIDHSGEYMSSEFIYFNRTNKPADGMYGRDVFKILKRLGVPPERIYKYNAKHAPNDCIIAAAKGNRISGYARVHTIDGAKRALIEHGPCYILLPMYNDEANFWEGDDGDDMVWHAVCIVGYTKDGFILRNSWGVYWNGDGHTLFPYSQWKLQSECWVALDEKNNKLGEHQDKDCTDCVIL